MVKEGSLDDWEYGEDCFCDRCIGERREIRMRKMQQRQEERQEEESRASSKAYLQSVESGDLRDDLQFIRAALIVMRSDTEYRAMATLALASLDVMQKMLELAEREMAEQESRAGE
jgi:hypothetical protein